MLSIVLGILAALVTFSIILIQIWLQKSKKKKQVLYGCGAEKLWIKKIKQETQVTSMSNMLVVSFVVLLLPNFLVEVFDPNWDLPELHIAGYIICWSWIFISPAVCILGCAHFRLAFKETYTILISRCENQDTNIVNSRFKKVHFSSLKSRVV